MAFYLLDSVTNFFFSFVIALIITTIIFKWFRERKYPPGPAGIPIFGYMLFLGKTPTATLRELSKKYGDVFSLYLGSQLNVVISDYHVAKEMLCNPKQMYRPEQLSNFMTGRGGFAGMNGEEWQDQRRFVFYTMRNLGLGKGLWETMIQEAVAELTEELKNTKGKPVDIDEIFGFFLASNTISLLLGRHLEKEKDVEQLKVIQESTREFMQYFGSATANAMIPWLRKFLETFRLFGYHKFFNLLRAFEDIFRKEMEERLKAPESLEKEDFIGFFHREMIKRKDETGHTYTMENLLGNLIILFVSSNDSSTSTITFLLLYMAAYPDVQKRVQDEIDSVAGRDGIIYYDDRNKFPYTLATMYEMLRHVSIAPLIPPRLATEDTTMNGYFVPKGSFLMVNVWSILHDPRYFKEPWEFNPERFFVDSDKVSRAVDGFIPFSVGKRNCPGEGVAYMTAFLYFASFMQKFKVTAPPGKKPDLEPIFGGANMPKPQELCFIER